MELEIRRLEHQAELHRKEEAVKAELRRETEALKSRRIEKEEALKDMSRCMQELKREVQVKWGVSLPCYMHTACRAQLVKLVALAAPASCAGRECRGAQGHVSSYAGARARDSGEMGR